MKRKAKFRVGQVVAMRKITAFVRIVRYKSAPSKWALEKVILYRSGKLRWVSRSLIKNCWLDSSWDSMNGEKRPSRVRHIRRVTTLTARADALQLSSLKVGDLRLILQYITPNKYFGEISEYDLDNLEKLLDKLDAEVARSLLR